MGGNALSELWGLGHGTWEGGKGARRGDQYCVCGMETASSRVCSFFLSGLPFCFTDDTTSDTLFQLALLRDGQWERQKAID